jgi:hypothetical protein
MDASGARFQSLSRAAARAVGVATLTLALALTGAPALAAGPSAGEVERLYVEGQQRAENKDYKGAADSWSRLLSILPESGDNQAIRESVIINVLDAHLKAYNQLVDESGNKDITHLRNGKQTLDQYYADYKQVHGDRVGVSAAVQDKAAELEAALAEAEENQSSGAATTNDPTPETEVLPEGSTVPDDRGDKVIVLQAQNNGTGLIVGGSVLAALGLGTLVMIPVGSIMARNAETDFENATDQSARDDAETRGQRGDAILISGAVLTPVLWGGAAAMIVFGIRARRRAKEEQQRAIQNISAAPVVTPRFSGFSLSGRF